MKKAKRTPKKDINEILLEAHERSIEYAIETSIRTGTPLVISKKGKIVEMQPKYQYVLVPIKKRSAKSPSSSKKSFFSRPLFV